MLFLIRNWPPPRLSQLYADNKITSLVQLEACFHDSVNGPIVDCRQLYSCCNPVTKCSDYKFYSLTHWLLSSIFLQAVRTHHWTVQGKCYRLRHVQTTLEQCASKYFIRINVMKPAHQSPSYGEVFQSSFTASIWNSTLEAFWLLRSKRPPRRSTLIPIR